MRVQDLKVGQELNGIVNSVAPFGCFVDVGAERDGLVHISRASDRFVDDMEALVQPGQAVKVWVVDVSPDGKLALTMVRARALDEREAADFSSFRALAADDWLEGIVATVADYGLFVSVVPPDGGPSVQGLVHISQIKEGFCEHPAEEARVGQRVLVRVVDASGAKLKLSMRPFIAASFARPDAQDVSPFEGLPPSTWLKGSVHHVAPFGVFVDVVAPSGGNAQGMVHIKEMREGFVQDPFAEVEVGQEVKVRVLSADVAAGRLSLSMKPEPGAA